MSNQTEKQIHALQLRVKALNTENAQLKQKELDAQLQQASIMTDIKKLRTLNNDLQSQINFLNEQLNDYKLKESLFISKLEERDAAIGQFCENSLQSSEHRQQFNEIISISERQLTELQQENTLIQIESKSLRAKLEITEKDRAKIRSLYLKQSEQLYGDINLMKQKLLEKDAIIHQLNQQLERLTELINMVEVQQQECQMDAESSEQITIPETILMTSENTIKQLQEENDSLRNDNQQLRSDIDLVNKQMMSLQRASQIDLNKDQVMRSLPKVLDNKLREIELISRMTPQLADKVIFLTEQQNHQEATITMLLQELRDKNKELAEALKSSQMWESLYQMVNQDRDYLITQTELLLHENTAAKKKLLDLIGEEETLKLMKERADFNSFDDLLDRYLSAQRALTDNCKQYFQ